MASISAESRRPLGTLASAGGGRRVEKLTQPDSTFYLFRD
jgi:hypothetical protein